MSTTYTYSSVLSGADLIYTLDTGDNFLISQSGSIVSPDTGAITADAASTDVSVLIMGLAWLRHIELFSHDDVTIGTTGTLQSSHDDAVILGAVGGNSTLTNQGVIVSTLGYGVSTFTGANFVTNSGTIKGSSGGVSMGMDYAPADQLYNTGSISSKMGEAVFMGGSQDTLYNYGLIHSDGGNAVRMVGDYNGSSYEASFVALGNYGDITTNSGYGVVADLRLEASHFKLINLGTIAGRSGCITSGDSSDTITNGGTLRGDILLHGGNDSYLGRDGHVYGNIDLGAGDDLFDGRGNTISGHVIGGSGNDTYYTDDANLIIIEDATPGEVDTVYAIGSYHLGANVENLTLLEGGDFSADGNASDNRITGNVGNNALSGDKGADWLYGMMGDDALLAANGADHLFGGDGNDFLDGGNGADSLNGGDGKDTLEGGFGRDVLTGGDQTDEFRFVDAARTSTRLARADVITDFKHGEDILNVHLIDADTTNGLSLDLFHFIGSVAFSHTAGELRYSYSGDRTIVAFDTDGGGTADGLIILRGHILLEAGDFFL